MTQAAIGFGSKLQVGDGGVGAATQASRTIGTSDSQLVLKVKAAGAAGNAKLSQITVSGNNTPLSVTVTASQITIVSETNGSAAAISTINDIIAELYQNATFREYFEATSGTGDGTGTLAAAAALAAFTGGADGAEAFTDIAEVTSIGGINFSGSSEEATHMQSPNGWREFLGTGLKDGGAIPFTFNYINNNAGQEALFRTLLSVNKNYRVVFPNTEYLTVNGILEAAGFTLPLSGKQDGSGSIKVSGEPTWSN